MPLRFMNRFDRMLGPIKRRAQAGREGSVTKKNFETSGWF
jgi:hypothetical protein